ncbi:MAG: zinc ribbon domain-containing protein [Deltaproteobacteria bacterium]|nr:zinc ribbon domain-containing protein [Deltaproteobacteria bacterium]
MPIFEYECQSCMCQFQSLIMKTEEAESIACPDCGKTELRKLVSRVAYHQSEKDRIDSYDPSARQSDSFMKDTRNIGLHAKKRAKEMGVDLGGGFDAKVEKLRTKPGSVLDSTE